MGPLCFHISCKDVHFQQLFHFVIEHFDAYSFFPIAGRNDFNHIAPHPKSAALKINIIAHILVLHQLPQDLIAVDDLTYPQRDHGIVVILRSAQAVNTAYTGHHDHIPAFKKSAGSAMAQFINLVVNGRIFFNISIRLGNIGFRLIIIVIRNKIFHRVVREKSF